MPEFLVSLALTALAIAAIVGVIWLLGLPFDLSWAGAVGVAVLVIFLIPTLICFVRALKAKTLAGRLVHGAGGVALVACLGAGIVLRTPWMLGIWIALWLALSVYAFRTGP